MENVKIENVKIENVKWNVHVECTCRMYTDVNENGTNISAIGTVLSAIGTDISAICTDWVVGSRERIGEDVNIGDEQKPQNQNQN